MTYENRKQFMQAVRKVCCNQQSVRASDCLLWQYRLTEFDDQCAAIRRGLATVVPISVLSVFTWQELQLEVCGQAAVDVDLLERNTSYVLRSASRLLHGATPSLCRYGSDMRSTDPAVRFFWTMMRTKFTDEERSKFLRFVWFAISCFAIRVTCDCHAVRGRSRLPLADEDFERKVSNRLCAVRFISPHIRCRSIGTTKPNRLVVRTTTCRLRTRAFSASLIPC